MNCVKPCKQLSGDHLEWQCSTASPAGLWAAAILSAKEHVFCGGHVLCSALNLMGEGARLHFIDYLSVAQSMLLKWRWASLL